jgi:broad specificity phosphatase PhoE
MATVFFITHPEVEIDPTVPVPMWGLNAAGKRRTKAMLKQPWIKTIDKIYTSYEQKAMDTAEIIAKHLHMGFERVESLGEIDRTSTGFLAPDTFEKARVTFFTNSQDSYRGWETAEAAQERIVDVVELLVHNNQGKTLALCSHGAVGTLLLCALEGEVITPQKDQPRAGCYFAFESEGMKLIYDWKLIDRLD